jgi:SpoIIAA-like
MFRFLDDMSSNVLAIEATGKVTHEDYCNTLVSRVEAMSAKGPIRMLYVIGKEFTGFELEALWDDGKLGLKHWRDFSHVAVVADQAWLRAAVSIFMPFFRGEVRMFGLSQLPAAKDWIADGQHLAA